MVTVIKRKSDLIIYLVLIFAIVINKVSSIAAQIAWCCHFGEAKLDIYIYIYIYIYI